MTVCSRWITAALTALLGASAHAAVPQGFASPRSSDGPLWIENRGQWDLPARFAARLGPDGVYAEQNALCLDLAGEKHRSLVRLVFEGASSDVSLEGEVLARGQYNFFLGNDPTRWVIGVPTYYALRYRNLYPGTDLIVHSREGGLEYDLELAPGADLSKVRIRFDGAQCLQLNEDGGLLLETAAGPIQQTAGRAWQVRSDGSTQDIAVHAVISSQGVLGFASPTREPNSVLVVDPGLVWSTYLGSATYYSIGDLGYDIDSGPSGDVTVVGFTDWPDYPTTPGAYVPPGGPHPSEAMFVTRLAGNDGSLRYSTVIGGNATDERATAVDVDDLGRATVVGWTSSLDFPTTPGAFDRDCMAFQVCTVVFRLTPAGDDLEFSTFLDSDSHISPHDVCVDPTSYAPVVVGLVTTYLLTTPGVFQPQSWGQGDGFIVKLQADGTGLEWATYLGGESPAEEVEAVAIDTDGSVVVTGWTHSMQFPVTPGAYQAQKGPLNSRSAFITRFNPTATQLLGSTILGGNETNGAELGLSVAIDRRGEILIAGIGASYSLPTTPGAYKTVMVGGDGFISRLSYDCSQLLASTFLGGDGSENTHRLAADKSGVVTVTSYAGPGFPTTPGALFPQWQGSYDLYVTRLDPHLSKLLYSTYLGGVREERPGGIALVSPHRVAVTGYCQGPGYPTTAGSASPNYNGGQADAIVSVLDLYLDGVEPFGSASPACGGAVEANATKMPLAGSSSFGLYCSEAPPLARGLLLVGVESPYPIPFQGAQLHVSRRRAWRRVPAATDAGGYVETALPLTGLAAGTRFACQYLFRIPQSCAATSNWCSSQGLRITVQ